MKPTPAEERALERAIELACQAGGEGNAWIGAVVLLDGEPVAEGRNRLLVPEYHPGRHAEMEALAAVDPALWPEATRMSVVTTLEPCAMCGGAILLHGIARVVFGAYDPEGGARFLIDSPPPYYRNRSLPEWIGPVDPEACDPLYERSRAIFDPLPCAGDLN